MLVKASPVMLSQPEVEALGRNFRTLGGHNTLVAGYIEYPFSSQGEMYFSPEALAVCDAFGLEVDGGMFFIIQPATILNELVPVSLPDSTYLDESGVEQSRVWSDYVFSTWDIGDGTILMMCRHKIYGDPNGTGAGCSNEERVAWRDHFGTLMVKAEGIAVIDSLSMI